MRGKPRRVRASDAAFQNKGGTQGKARESDVVRMRKLGHTACEHGRRSFPTAQTQTARARHMHHTIIYCGHQW